MSKSTERAKVRIHLSEVPLELLNRPYWHPPQLPNPSAYRRHYEQFTLPVGSGDDEMRPLPPIRFVETKKILGRNEIKGRTKRPLP